MIHHGANIGAEFGRNLKGAREVAPWVCHGCGVRHRRWIKVTHLTAPSRNAGRVFRAKEVLLFR